LDIVTSPLRIERQCQKDLQKLSGINFDDLPALLLGKKAPKRWAREKLSLINSLGIHR
jgi:hypothetical protein